jgi:uncharacterized protein (DUF1697 family)
VFTSRSTAPATLERKAEAAMRRGLGQAFLTIVRPVDALQAILESDPYEPFRVARNAKRIVTFLRNDPQTELALPIERDGARILRIVDREVFSAYLPSPKGAVFMTLIENAFGTEVTTRTWATVEKVARA